MATLVLMRHGQSEWNLQNRFTGWKDVDLTAKGHEEAIQAGKRLAHLNLFFDKAYTSVLTRAIKTLWHVLDQTDHEWIPVVRSWKLNERHYGALTGLNKAETKAKYGEEQVQKWRRGYSVIPPEMTPEHEFYTEFHERRYEGVEVPTSESLELTAQRVLPYWERQVLPELQAQKNILIVAHGNSLRALVMSLKGMSDKEIVKLNIPTGQPLLFDYDSKTNVFLQHEDIV